MGDFDRKTTGGREAVEMAANALLLPRRGMRAVASLTFVAAMAACALIVVVFSGVDRAELVQLASATGGGGYALPPGYEISGKDLETRDHNRWWDHHAPSPERKPAHPAPADSGMVVKTELLPKEILDAMVCRAAMSLMAI